MNCSRNIVGRRRLLIAALVAVCVFLVGGCGDLIPARSAGVEASRILRDLRRIEMDPDPNVPLPHFFTAPPKIIEQTVGGESEWKLFYFCQHTGCEEMRKIVDAQFASILVNAKGKSTKTVDYVVSSNPSTNQLIVRCPNLEDAEAILEFLREVDVPPTQVKISCLISEIYADKTLDWETSIEIADLLGESIWAGPAGRTFGSAIDQLVQETSMPAFPGASLRELARKKMGLKVGYLSKSHKFLAVVDMLESQGYLKILMNPTLTIMNGKTAKVMSTQKVPLSRTTLRSAQSDFFESSQEWEDVVDSLEITPHVYAHGVIGLETSILIGSKLTPEGVIQLPIITKKQITNAETRIRPGESLIIGGLRKTERRDVVRGIPILKDIPLIGVLFSGRDFEERAVETIFVLTPTISPGGVPHKEMIATIQRKRGEPTVKEIEAKAKDDTGLDPFGFKARAKERKGKLEEAEQTRIEAEAEKALARHTMRDAMDRIEKAEAEAELAKARSVRAVADAKKMKEAAEAAKAEADAKAKAADAAKAVADKAIADAAKTKTESDAKTKAAAEAMAAAEKIANDATKTKEEAEKAKAEAAAKAKEAEQSKVAADEKAKAADLAKAEADAKAKAAQQAQADADAKAVAAEKVKADSEIQAKEAQGVKALADAKTKAAEKLKAEADAKALAAEKLRAEAEQVIAEANKDKPEPKQPQSDTDSTSAKEPAPEEDKVVAKGQPENVEGDGDGNSDDAAADPPANDPNKPSANAQKSTPNETKTPAKAPDGTSAKPDAEKPKPKDGDNSTEKQPDDKTAKDDADESKSKAKKPPAKDKKTKPETEEDAEAKLIMLVLSALRL